MKISHTVFKLQNGHKYIAEIAIFNVQRAMIPELGNQKLWFMSSACLLMLLYICVKFRENISNGIKLWSGHNVKVTDGRMDCRQMARWTNTKNFRGYNIIPCYFFVSGHKNNQWILKKIITPLQTCITLMWFNVGSLKNH